MEKEKKDNAANLTQEERIKAEKAKQAKLKAQREAEAFKRNYFAYYDDIKISHREDW